MTPDQQRIGVVGGGMAGLTAALRLAQAGYAVTLWERAAQAAFAVRRSAPSAQGFSLRATTPRAPHPPQQQSGGPSPPAKSDY